MFHCAFNFPAVLLTLGKDQWPRLKEVHTKLTRDFRTKVRRTLSYSLFEVAKILGPELTESELVEVLFFFLDDVNEVKEGVLKSLPEFLAQIETSRRGIYIEKLVRLWSEPEDDWRKREQRVIQLGQLSKLLTPEIFEDFFFSLYFKVLEDKVATVRRVGALACYPIVKLLSQDREKL